MERITGGTTETEKNEIENRAWAEIITDAYTWRYWAVEGTWLDIDGEWSLVSGAD